MSRFVDLATVAGALLATCIACGGNSDGVAGPSTGGVAQGGSSTGGSTGKGGAGLAGGSGGYGGTSTSGGGTGAAGVGGVGATGGGGTGAAGATGGGGVGATGGGGTGAAGATGGGGVGATGGGGTAATGGGTGTGGSGGTIASGAVPSCSATFSNTTPACGTTVNANWSCTNAVTCSYACTGDTTSSGVIPCTGTSPFQITKGVTCVLTGKNGAGVATSSASVACDGRPACSAFFSVPGPPSKCPVSGNASWSCVNATSCSYNCSGDLSGSGPVACNGSTLVNLVAGTSCTLTATGDAGVTAVNVSATCP